MHLVPSGWLLYNLLASALFVTTVISGSVPNAPQYLVENPPPDHLSASRIPTIHESAILARRILKLSSIATLATVFPLSNTNDDGGVSSHAMLIPPQGVSGAPIGLMDYYASCSPNSHTPTILAISIATSFRNTRAGSNMSLSLRWHPPNTASGTEPPIDKIHQGRLEDPYLYSPANMPRFSLEGYIEAISASEVSQFALDECFFNRHPDARAWRPGNEIHESWWARLVVTGIYWIGGFGDRAYIGWIPVKEWEGVTEEEVKKARLVGEEGWEGSAGSPLHTHPESVSEDL